MTFTSSIKICFLFFLIFVSGSKLRAQNALTTNDTLRSVIAAGAAGRQAKLFIHYDKTVYLPNETIWFTAYRLSNMASLSNADILSVVIVKNDDRAIVIQKKFRVKGSTSFGSILIQDTIAAGDYSIIAYTNHSVKGMPDELFTQRISIKRIGQADRNAKLKSPAIASFTKTDSAQIKIKFYPEGGDLVANLSCYVGWEAKDGTGAALKVKGVLLKDGEFIDTVETSAYGMGKFFIKPKFGSKYTVKLTDNSQRSFNLPSLIDRGVALTLPASLVHDTLVLKIASTLTGKVHILVHNARKVFYALTNIEPKEGKLFKVALDSLPSGLAAVTILNENLKPCAERVFFAHYDSPPTVSLKADAQKYGKRQKVTVKLNLNSNTATPALISVVCVQENRINRRFFNDIDNYGYLTQELNFLPASLNGDGNLLKRKNLEDVLLVRGWRRYIDTTTAHSLQSDTVPRFTGIVTIEKKQAKKPMTLTLMGNSKVLFVNTDNSGNFSIADDDMVVPDGKTLALFATGDNAFATHISLTDPFVQINQSLAAKLLAFDREALTNEKISEPELSIVQNQVLLKEVKIKAPKDDQLFNGAATPGLHTNACGDYVCIVNGLNCPYPGHTHRTSIPIKGHRYFRHGNMKADGWLDSNEPVIYEGCQTKNQSLIRFSGINLSKEFYGYNNTDVNTTDPLYNSTLYWHHQISLTKGKQTELSFYTGDISGKFDIIIQGITDSSVVYSEDKFEVAK